MLSLPRILCVHLKRFRNSHGYTRKLDCRVTFPETFDIFEILKGAFSPDFVQVLFFLMYFTNYLKIVYFVLHKFNLFFQNDCKYTLHAVVVHSGTAMFGHYTAYVRRWVNKRWYYANDSSVKQVLPI